MPLSQPRTTPTAHDTKTTEDPPVRRRRPVLRSAASIAIGCVALLGLATVVAGPLPGPDVATAPTAAGSADEGTLSFGGADIDESGALRRGFGLDGDRVKRLAHGDMNGDGHLDLVAGKVGQDAVYINDGRGNFDHPGSEIPFGADDSTGPDHFALGDLDGDGDLDAIGWHRGPSALANALFLNDGAGHLYQQVSFAGGNSSVTDVAIADLNDDGALDIVMARDLTGNGQNSYVLNSNTGASPPSFGAEQDLGPADDNSRGLATGDVNGDGAIDIVVANGEAGDAQVSTVYLNDGSGGFASGDYECAVQWEWGVPTSGPGSAHSGSRLWATNLDGDYADNKLVWTTSPPIDLTSGSTPVVVSWWQWIRFHSGEYMDLFKVDVSKDGGTTWSTVSSQGPRGTWYQGSVELDGSYLVSDFRVRFGLDSDHEGTDDGFFIDDVKITAGVLDPLVVEEDFEADAGGYVGSETPFPAGRAHCLGKSGHNTTSAALGDMNADGHLDIVLGNQSWLPNPRAMVGVGGEERLYLNNGSGRFDSPGNQSAFGPAVDDTWQIALGDVDGDGRLDVALGERGGQDLVRYNDGGASPGFASNDTVGPDLSETQSVALADLDDDGALDIVLGLDGQQSRAYLSPGALAYLESLTELGGEVDMTEALALGDIDQDGDLDLVVGNSPPHYGIDDERSHLFLNDGSGAFPDGLFDAFSAPVAETRAVAVGDLTGNGALDVLLGVDGGQNRYLSPLFDGSGALTGFANACPDNCFGTGTEPTNALAVGDVNRDGSLDIVVGNHGSNTVHLNDGTGGFSAPGSTIAFGEGDTSAVALGDLNGDGFLDAVLGNRDGESIAYLNDGAGGFDDPASAQPLGTARDTRGLAVGDMNGDGALDVVQGNYRQQNRIYLGDGRGGFADAAVAIPFGGGDNATRNLALSDVNGDGAIDIVAVGGGDPTRTTLESAHGVDDNYVYLNDRADPPNFGRQRSFGQDDGLTTSVAVGDLNGDGTPDIVAGNQPQNWDDGKNPLSPIRLYRREIFISRQRLADRLPDQLPVVRVVRPGATADGQGHSSPEILSDTVIDVPVVLYQADSVPVGRVELSYSTNGGGAWLPASVSLAGGSPPTLLATSPGGVAHTLRWDTFASGLFGQSDDVVLRIRAYPQPPTDAAGTYGYDSQVAGPPPWPYATATTFPFRVRGTQVRVTQETAGGAPAPDALVYRLPAGQEEGGQPFTTAGGEKLRTDADGFLRGSGAFGVGDRLIALWPVSTAEHYILYHTSAPVIETGLRGHEVTDPGVVPLVVKAEQPLMLFNLDVSLEWDARYDTAFMTRLDQDIRRASEVLYDVTNGQVALGPVRINQAKQEWLAADVLVYAANNLRPAASMGGVVDDLVDDEHKNGQTIEDAYVPGQVQMGPTWGRYGEPDNDLGDDWPRALAHELAHYFLFQFDNYLGIVDGRLVPNDCPGSVMTDAYTDEYSEFLDRGRWTGACLDTLAEYTTGRTDWETILTFYPWLNTNNVDLLGPSSMPLEVTEVESVDPAVEVEALSAPFYSLREGGNRLYVAAGSGQGYLFKNQDTPDLTDDYVLAVGSPIGDQMHARGAVQGDRLCVFDQLRDPVRIGCSTIGAFEGSVAMEPVPGWRPQIEVSPVATGTLAITVTQSAAGGLFAQVLPGTGFTSTFPITSTVAELPPVPGQPDTYAADVELAYPLFQAHIRIWEEGATPQREAMTQFVLGDGWGPNHRAWGPNHRAWGPNHRAWGPNHRAWGAPVSSGDGQVTVYNLTDIFGDTGTSALQSLTTMPPVPSWLRPIGTVQRFESSSLVERTMAFNYLQQEVPGGDVYEEGMRIYYSADDGQTWTALDTVLDVRDNLATCVMPDVDRGDGLYMLAVTIEMPPLVEGWNQFGYPVAGERPVGEALASIEDDYRLVYDNGPTAEGPWRLYDQEVLVDHPDLAELVNDLDVLEFGGVYWIYTLRATQAFLGLPLLPGDADPDSEGLAPLAQPDALEGTEELPPATLYGWVTPSPGFAPTTGMEVVATIDGVECGRTALQDLGGQLAYRLQVGAARPDLPTCGNDGATIVLAADGITLAESPEWDNTRARFLPLGTLATIADLSVDLTFMPSAPQPAEPHAILATVRNLGPMAATEVVLASPIPERANFVFAADENQHCAVVVVADDEGGGFTSPPANPAGGYHQEVHCRLGTIPALATRQVIIAVEYKIANGNNPYAEDVSHSASVTAVQPDPDAINNESQLTIGPDPGRNVVIDGCDTGVPDLIIEGGITFMDTIDDCAANAKNHNKFYYCVARAARTWKLAGLIIGIEKLAINSCANGADIP